MARFNARPLGALDRIYRFVGGLRGSSRVDIESPITLVHDVSREAEIGSGFFQLNKSQSLTVALSTTDYVALTRDSIVAAVKAELDQLGLAAETVSVWWVRSFMTIDDTDDNLSNANVGLVQGSQNFVNDDGQILYSYNFNLESRATVASDRQLGRNSTSISPPTSIAEYKPLGPLLLIPGSNTAIWLGLTSTAGGSCTVQAHHVFWFGPEGAGPPPYGA